MHFALRGYLFIALTALLGVAGTWSEVPAFAGAWLVPAFLLLLGLAFEAWYMRGTRVKVRMHVDERLKLGRPASGAFAFSHNRGRELTLQYARVLPAALRQTTDVRSVELPADEELLDPAALLPLRLGAGRFGELPARLLGRFALAWWTRALPQNQPFTVAPDSVPGGARPVAGESAGETPRRLPGVGVELLQLRDYVAGDALSRIDWKATARRGTLISREYSEAQHLEILLVVDAGRGSRVRAGALDRLGLYANVAARLAEHAVSIEDRVGLLVYADRTLSACMPDRGIRAVARLRRSLEILESNRGESNPIAAAIQVRRLLRHRGLVVWLTDLAEPARNDELMQALKALVPRHQPIVAAPHAAEIARLASDPAREWRDPAIALAAREHTQRAQLQVASLRRQGIVVLDEPDDRLDRAVLDTYLQLRRRRRI
ncbi:MAG TPA: DUF58 domain-containing protein [Steroidobacteraceae bacterium]|jgi:uncharacterized protein (DUF58 family)|nr:DUF58 domain-containing protein [Steroidobacteraceae bacterium]